MTSLFAFRVHSRDPPCGQTRAANNQTGCVPNTRSENCAYEHTTHTQESLVCAREKKLYHARAGECNSRNQTMSFLGGGTPHHDLTKANAERSTSRPRHFQSFPKTSVKQKPRIEAPEISYISSSNLDPENTMSWIQHWAHWNKSYLLSTSR